MYACTDVRPAIPRVVSASVLATLERICPGGVGTDVPLASISRWRIGGPADAVVTPRSVPELSALLRFLSGAGLPRVVIGSTSNLLFADEGLRAVAIRIDSALGGFTASGAHVTAGAGLWVPSFARRVMQAGLEGAEHVAGIPGTLGGLLCMNGGSQRRGIGDSVTAIHSLDATGNPVCRPADACGFGYRRSVFQRNDEVVVSAEFRFSPAASRSDVRRRMIAILADRRRKFPKSEPSCGSVFISDPALYATEGPPGAVIERLGLKGLRRGGAKVSERHANWIVNLGDATARDVLELVTVVRGQVVKVSGHALHAEVRYMRADGTNVALHEVN